MHLRLRERDPDTRRWLPLHDGPVADPIPELTLNEARDLEVAVGPVAPGVQVRLEIGGWLAASSRSMDRTDFEFRRVEQADGTDWFVVRGRLVKDWVGITELQLLQAERGEWAVVATVRPVFIAAGKMAQEEFAALCEDVAAYSAAALLDVYGKTYFGLELEHRPGESAPVATTIRIRQALDQLATALREIASQPAYRLRATRVREPAIADQGVTDLTLEEACLDPTVAVYHRGRLAFREQVREVATPHYNLPENRVLSGFLHFLDAQLADLANRLHSDVALREGRKAERHRPPAPGEKSWWETEDLPRIIEMRRMLEQFRSMRTELARLRRYPFLPPGVELRDVPPSTPLIRSNRAYAAAYRVILSHFRAFRIRLDGGHLLTRGKSLPVLYEWWCALEVLRVLRESLTLSQVQPSGRGTVFQHEDTERTGFVVEFEPDRAVDFEDESGRLVRLRYVPSYRREADSGGSAVGLLSPDQERTPDLALEVFAPGDRDNPVPELIVVLDAKYTTQPHSRKLDEVRLKYDKIGVFETGRVLSRQVWAIVPTGPDREPTRGPDWARYCTVDNIGFWSERYDMGSPTAGVVRAKPRFGEGRPPLDGLIRLILKRAGVAVRL
jgi:hypothetical protein